MAKQRPSVHKRLRDQAKREREMRKAEKNAMKREQRLNRDQPSDATEVSPEAMKKSGGDGTELE